MTSTNCRQRVQTVLIRGRRNLCAQAEREDGCNSQLWTDLHLAGIYACDSLAVPISSSQLISRDVATARLSAVQGFGAAALVLVEVGAGRRMRVLGCGVGRRAHSSSRAGVEICGCEERCRGCRRAWSGGGSRAAGRSGWARRLSLSRCEGV
jgi:hypothetical protein